MVNRRARMINPAEIRILEQALGTLAEGFADLPEFEADIDSAAIARVLNEVAVKMRDNYPYHHPRYAGQMLKPPHAVARIAYALSLWINPNNHALDGGRASSAMEKECIRAIAGMFGLNEPLGHLCGGGTMANLEALWVAGRLKPGQTIVASSQAHYTHSRISEVLGLGFEAIPADTEGRMAVEALERRLAAGGVGTIVATLGTTGLGAVDPLPEILELARQYDARVHVDAAYGGYFILAEGLAKRARCAFEAIGEADSVVIDPHKHGLQPYGCGCVLFRDPAVGALYKHDSPYTYFSSAELHLGEISLECSRPGAAAVALWATQRLFPMERGGNFARSLDRGLTAARHMWQSLSDSDSYRPLLRPETDIVIYGPKGNDAQSVSAHSARIFDEAARRDLHLALIELPGAVAAAHWPGLKMNRDRVRVLRSCLMKPEHLDWVDDFRQVLEDSAAATAQ